MSHEPGTPEPLSIPALNEDVDTLTAAFAYAKHGWYVVPVRHDGKHPGSILGKGWPAKSSRDPQDIAAWFAGADLGLALHVGRSGAISFDVDEPDRMPPVLANALAQHRPPHQSSRNNIPLRGHWVFRVPPGRDLGNSLGGLGKGWGEVRGRNGVIVVGPTRHEKAAIGGRYLWTTHGPLPELPDDLAVLLPDAITADDAATDVQIKQFLIDHATSERPQLLGAVLTKFTKDVAAGGSRHEAALAAAVWAMKEARAGFYPADKAADTIRTAFLTALRGERHGPSEWAGILAWAVAQARATNLDTVRGITASTARPPNEPQRPAIVFSAPATAPDPDDTPSDGNAAVIPMPRLTVIEGGLTTYRRSDDGNALALIEEYGGVIRYVPDRGAWLAWDGSRWEWCPPNDGIIREYAKQVARKLPEQDKADVQHKQRSLGAGGISAMLTQAATDPRIAVKTDQLDADPWALNTPAGIVDLRTGELRAPDPAALCTRVTNCAPDAGADPTRWNDFLDDTFGGDQALIAYMQGLVGYSATGKVGWHVFPFSHGSGGNGKGVFLEATIKVLGDYATTAPNSFLMAKSNPAHETEIARLLGARMVLCSEVNEKDRFDEERVKKLTGGDTVTARFLYQNHFSFEPSHHLWLMGNSKPAVAQGGRSFWRRVRLIPFLNEVPEDKQVDDLQKILAAEHGPALLHWIIQGSIAYANKTIVEPEIVRAATADYALDQDTVKQFVDERCSTGPASHVQTQVSKVREAYERWCAAQGETPVSAKRLSTELAADGIDLRKSNGRRFYAGLRLNDEEEGSDSDPTLQSDPARDKAPF